MHTEVTFLIYCSLLCTIALCLRGQCTYLSKKYFTAKKKKKKTFTAKKEKDSPSAEPSVSCNLFTTVHQHAQNFIKCVKPSKFIEEFEIL